MTSSPARSKKKRVTFKLQAPEAKEVFVAGTFNDWAPAERPLKRNRDGIWTTWMSLAPGAYEYRFVVDGEWREDPAQLDTHEKVQELERKIFAQKAQAIYERRLKKQFESTHRGQIVAIEVDSGEVFTGRTALEAGLKARGRFPDKLFYFIRVGFPAVHSLKGHGQGLPVEEKS